MNLRVSSWRRWPRRRKVWTALIVLGIIFIVITVKLLSSPAQGQIAVLATQTKANQQTSEYLRADTRYISFAYPKNYRLEKGDTSEVILESHRLVASGRTIGASRTIAITVFNLPDGRLENNSAYKIRHDNPNLYEVRSESINANLVIFFKNKNDAATVAFMQQGGKLATIGFSGAIRSDEAEAEYRYVISSWQWQ